MKGSAVMTSAFSPPNTQAQRPGCEHRELPVRCSLKLGRAEVPYMDHPGWGLDRKRFSPNAM